MIIQPSGCQKGRVFRSRNRILISTSAQPEFTDFWLFLCPQDIFVVVDVAVLQHRINPSIPSHLRQIFFITCSWSILPVRYLSATHGWRVGCSAEQTSCQKIRSCSYITLVISRGSFWTFAHSTLLWQEKGYKTLGPVSCCHLGENLSGLRVPSDWIIMNNEWSFMPHWGINKTGLTGRNSVQHHSSNFLQASTQLVGSLDLAYVRYCDWNEEPI